MKKKSDLQKKAVEGSDRSVSALQEHELEQVSGGDWGDERSESPVNDWEDSAGTTSTLITDTEHSWLQEGRDGNSTSAWYGLKNDP